MLNMKETVVHLLQEAAEKYADTPYLAEKTDAGWQKSSFEDVNKKSDIFASFLLQTGFQKEDKIAILAEGRTAWVIAEYGIVKSRCIAVPLSVKLTQEEILFRLQHSDSKAIISSHNHIEKIIPLLQEINLPSFKIIYLDDDRDFIQQLNAKHGFNLQDYIIYYQDIITSSSHTAQLLNSIEQIEEEDVVTISYTSGTTGNPKGIMLTHKNYYSNSKASYEMFDIQPRSKLFNVLPLDHSFAHTVGIYVSTLIPYTIYFLDTRGGAMAALKNIPLNINEVKPNLMLSVPALSGKFMKNIQAGIEKKGKLINVLFRKGLKASMQVKTSSNPFVRLINYPLYAIANNLIFRKIKQGFGGELRFMVGGGALLDIKQQEFFYAIGMPIFQGYGLTEASPVISSNTPEVHKLGTSGKIIPGIRCLIVEDGKEVEKGKKGEIVVDGDNVMKGYYKNPKATQETIREGLLFTGDLGYYDEDGYLMVSGRAKALLISEDGEKYSPEEIEETILSTCPFVEHVMLYNDHSKFTSALMTLRDDMIRNFIKKQNISSSGELLEHIHQSLFAFKQDSGYQGKFQEKWIPNVYRFVDEPFTEQNKMVNSTMKMVRFKIAEHYSGLLRQIYQEEKNASMKYNRLILEKYFHSK
jgi:long-chain acyl-CoA synthetase